MSTETVDQYSLRFQRLLRKVNGNNDLVPAALQVRMYLYGLVPMLTPLVSIDNPANLAAAMERARTVEIGYNYTPSKEIVTASTANQEVDELTKKIEQLSLNYATLASALAVQPVQNNKQQELRPRFQRFSQQNNNRTCYNCNQLGHIVRNCPSSRRTFRNRTPRRTRFTSSCDVHYADFQDEEKRKNTTQKMKLKVKRSYTNMNKKFILS